MTKTNTFKEHLQRATLKTLRNLIRVMTDEGTWPDQQKDNDKDKHNGEGKDKDNFKCYPFFYSTFVLAQIVR